MKTDPQPAAVALPDAELRRTRTIQLGALCDSLQDQIGDLLPPEKLKTLDHMADAITTCYVHGLIGDTASDLARKRLMKKIHVAIAAERAHAAREERR